MNTDKKNFELATLKDRDGDTSKRWYIEFKAPNSVTGKLQRKHIYLPTKLKTSKERRKWASGNIHNINLLLKAGFCFGETERLQKPKRLLF